MGKRGSDMRFQDFAMYAFPSLVTVFALLVYFVVTINVGRSRFKHQIKPPIMTGNLEFECALRVQQNTLEQLILFLPSLWLFALYVSPLWGAIVGGIWVIGRIVYAVGYYQAPEKRTPGFAISSLSVLTLLIGSLVGIGLDLLP
jgi:glutathione S-transferase